jgi:hypothetical protein
MHVHISFFTCTILAACLLFSAACISPGIPGSIHSPQQVTETGTSSPVSPAITRCFSPSPSPTPGRATVNTTGSVPTGIPVPSATKWIPTSTGRDAMDEPRIALLSFVKECKPYNLPDCGMREAFPQIAGDSGYGIRQKAPKLAMLTPEDIEAFEKTYASRTGVYPDTERYIDPNTLGGARCAGVPADPRWNFVRINATLIPRNPRPGEYDIGINVRSRGTIIEQLRMNRTFVIEEPVTFVRYIPLKLDEMEAFDSIELVFSRRT